MTASRRGVPWVAICFQALFGFLAYMGIGTGSGKVFIWFQNMYVTHLFTHLLLLPPLHHETDFIPFHNRTCRTSVAGLMTWFGICVTYIRFYQGAKAQGIDRKTFSYVSPFQPFAAYYGAGACLIICVVRTLSDRTFILDIHAVYFHFCLPATVLFHALRRRTVQWLERLPSPPMEHSYLHNQLPPSGIIPDLVLCREMVAKVEDRSS